MIKEDLGKCEPFPVRNLRPGYFRIWRRLRYSITFFYWSSPASASAAPFKSQKAQAGTGRIQKHPLQKKIRFENI